ncbi:MAG: hypothetical protein P8N76_12415 [Pirellulaceae bacterium]|nr:hypothetical protein [Pirellulaceae bacterium]
MQEIDTAPRLQDATSYDVVLLFAAPLMGAAAGGMGWGIRGQYGHEWGAMVPGVLVGFVLVFLFSQRLSSLTAARAVALTALGFSFGGTMTYGQTVGLTHDTPLVGNDAAYQWGMVGLFVKGGLWIGFGGAFLGIGLGGKQYRWKEIVAIYVALLFLIFLGIQVLNRPYVPGTDRELAWFFFPEVTTGDRALPWIYFSDHWKWEPENLKMDPRPELWGGLLAAFVGLVTYVRCFKKDRLAFRMALLGVLAGGLGFTLGQTLQAKHSWTPNWLTEFDVFLHTALPAIFPEKFFSLMGWNWWNMMETTFGLVLGFVLGLGLWFNRKHISATNANDAVAMNPYVEWVSIIIYAVLLFLWSVPRHDSVELLGDYPLGMGLIPLVGILSGRIWPYMFSLPLVAVPIAGITYKITDKVHPYTDRFLLFIFPLAVMAVVAFVFERRGRQGQRGLPYARYGLILSVVVYFSLNFVFFGYPWATLPNGGRHTNNWIFLRCSELLIFGALLLHRRDPPLEVENESTQSSLRANS